MKEYLLKKDNVKTLCLKASEQWETYIPAEVTGADVLFTRINRNNKNSILKQLNLDYESLVVPPKVIFFPQLESLFEFQNKNITKMVATPSKKLLFGLRACDAKAILLTDDFFRRNFEDVYYLHKSQGKLLVIVACRHPLDSCFCTSAKTGPFLETGFDLQLIDIGADYLVETGSKKGEEFVDCYREFFDEALKDHLESAKKVKRDVEKAVSLKVDFEEAIKKFCEDKVPQQIYETIAERCIYCGGCLYVCPTCTCFNVFDTQSAGSGARCRNWDACVFEGYTREASGHNPRHEKWIRTSRRYEHKLKYDYLTTGMSSCVGCGRCLASCPVNIGISQIIEEVTKS